MRARLLLLLALLSSSMALPAKADRLDDDLNTLWEATWDQRGVPLLLQRWEQPIRYRLSGSDAERYRPVVVRALTSAAQAANVSLTEAAPDAQAAGVANLTVELVDVDGSDLPPDTPCVTQTTVNNFVLSSVRMRLRRDKAAECVHHEAMHALGVPGHPSGRTVLSYFASRNDALTDMDRVLLAVWYERSLRAGAAPFEILWVGGQRVVSQPDVGSKADDALRRRQSHYDARLQEMVLFARGEGDVPAIIKRSGRANTGLIDEARATVAHYLGGVYQHGVGVTRDDANAVFWYRHAAQRGHPPAKVMLAWALMGGIGTASNWIEAHRWLSGAADAGNPVARTELERLEKAMKPTQRDEARALGPR
jgi:hypothetical protein